MDSAILFSRIPISEEGMYWIHPFSSMQAILFIIKSPIRREFNYKG